MKQFPWIAWLLGAAALPAQEPLKLVATTPDLASLARTIGGGAVEVSSLVEPGQDPHFVLAKASLLLKLSRADALLIVGLNYEHAFLPALLEKCRNERVLPGAKGYLNVGERIRPLEVPERLDRGLGADLHPLGNPHYTVDPANGRIMARAVADLLERVDPARSSQYEERWRAWDQEAERRIAEWDKLMEPLRGAKLVTYHRSWPYFAARYGLELVGEVEPKPGLAPTPGHLAELAQLIKREQVRVLLMEPWYSERNVASLIQTTGVKVLRLPVTCGTTAGATEYLDYLDFLVRSFVQAHAGP